MHFVSRGEINEDRGVTPNALNCKPGTWSSKIHQIAVIEDGLLFYRELSCFCPKNDSTSEWKYFFLDNFVFVTLKNINFLNFS